MPEILISIKPKYVDLILSGLKRVELRKRIGNEFIVGTRIFIYSSSPVKMIVGAAVISDVSRGLPSDLKGSLLNDAKISVEEYDAYFKGCSEVYGVWLKDVTVLRQGVPLEFIRRVGMVPPQSYSYIRSEELLGRLSECI